MAIVKNSNPDALAMALNPMAYKLTADAADMRVLIELYIEQVRESGNYERIAEIDQAVADDKSTIIRVEELLKSYLGHDLPTVGQSTAKTTLEIIKRYKVRYAQRDLGDHQLIDDLYQTTGAREYLFLSNKLEAFHAYEDRAWTDDDTGLFVTLSDGTNTYLANSWAQHGDYYSHGFTSFADEYIKMDIPSDIRFEIISDPASFTYDTTRHAALAGWNRKDFPGRTAGKMPGNQFYMSVKNTRRITRDQVEWIYAMSDAAVTNYIVRFDLYFTDATSEFFTVDYGAVVANQPIIIPVGYDIHDYDNVNGAKTIERIRVNANSADFYITMYPRDIPGPFVKEFYFMNSLGGIDSFIAPGKAKESMQYTRETVEKYVPEDYAAVDAQYEDHNVQMRKNYTVATGWVQKNSKWDEVQTLRDMIFSRQVYVKEINNLVPVSILNKEDLMQIDGEYLKGGQIQYQYAFEEVANAPA